MDLSKLKPWSPPSPINSPGVPDDEAPSGERRRHPRFPAVEDRARLRWEEGAATRERLAFLVDISRGGARLTSEDLILDGTTLKISLEGADGQGAEVVGRIVRISRCGGVGHLIHIEFLYPCPDALFQRAIGGPDMIEPATRAK